MLKGTVWKFKNSGISHLFPHPTTWSQAEGIVDINFKVAGSDTLYVRIYDYWYYGGGTYTDNFKVYTQNGSSVNTIGVISGKEVTFYSEPIISGTSSLTEDSFITWLESNATFVGPVPSRKLEINNKTVKSLGGKKIGVVNDVYVMCGK